MEPPDEKRTTRRPRGADQPCSLGYPESREMSPQIIAHPLPTIRDHTVGELATLFNEKYGIGADLVVMRTANLRRSQWFDETGLPWVNPSPNLRSPAALASYPGSVYFEGTTLTEGRGTDRPFEQIGAPWLDAQEVARVMNDRRLPGIRFEPITMFVLPTAAKYSRSDDPRDPLRHHRSAGVPAGPYVASAHRRDPPAASARLRLGGDDRPSHRLRQGETRHRRRPA